MRRSRLRRCRSPASSPTSTRASRSCTRSPRSWTPRRRSTARPPASSWTERRTGSMQHRDGPFFLYLHVFDPHSPYEPRAPYDALWADRTQARRAHRPARLAAEDRGRSDVCGARHGHPAGNGQGRTSIRRVTSRTTRTGTTRSIRALDSELARLFERLRSAGVDRDTAVVFLSDHGEEFQDHGRMWHGQSVYGEMVHVPLVVRWPASVPAGMRDRGARAARRRDADAAGSVRGSRIHRGCTARA